MSNVPNVSTQAVTIPDVLLWGKTRRGGKQGCPSREPLEFDWNFFCFCLLHIDTGCAQLQASNTSQDTREHIT